MILKIEDFKTLFEQEEPLTKEERIEKKVAEYFSKWNYEVEEFVDVKTRESLSLLDFLKATDADIEMPEVNLFVKKAVEKIVRYISLNFEPKYNVPFEFIRVPKIVFEMGDRSFYPIYRKKEAGSFEVISDFWALLIIHMGVEKKAWQSREEGIHYITGRYFEGLYGYNGLGKTFWINSIRHKFKDPQSAYEAGKFSTLFKKGTSSLDSGTPEIFKPSDPKIIFRVGQEVQTELSRLERAIGNNLVYKEEVKKESTSTLYISNLQITRFSDILYLGKSPRIPEKTPVVFEVDHTRTPVKTQTGFIVKIVPTETPTGIISELLLKKGKNYVVAMSEIEGFKTSFYSFDELNGEIAMNSRGSVKCNIKISGRPKPTRARTIEPILPEEELTPKKRGRIPLISAEEKTEIEEMIKEAGSDGITRETLIDLLGTSPAVAYKYLTDLGLPKTNMSVSDTRYTRSRGKIPLVYFYTQEDLESYLAGESNYFKKIIETLNFRIRRFYDFIGL